MSEKKENKTVTGLEIAVIGISGRFPGAKNIDEFWNNLKNGVESISFFSNKELEQAGAETMLLENPDYVKAKAVMADIEYFDSDFFNFTPREAEMADPQLRIFLECAWHALEDAGYHPDTDDNLIGLYAGNAVNYYWVTHTNFNKKYNLSRQSNKGFLNHHFSTQFSYHLNLKGPAPTIQTDCSTSLVAIHSACLGILNGECRMALAGGVSIVLPKKSGYYYQEGLVVSPDGHCRAFDLHSKGSIFGDGVGVVVLKRLEDALEDGDFIYAVIKGSAINNDSKRKVGYTPPAVEGLVETLNNAYMTAEVEPESISYIETHGAGTEPGDPVEIEALKIVFSSKENASCPIGTVKTNVGHLHIASGVTAFIKTVLALKHRLLPPSLHFETPNPKIHFENSPFYVNTELKVWENNMYPLRAGVSSFGLSGTNAHVILEEFSEGTRGLAPLPDTHTSRQYQLILLSARTQTALKQHTENFIEYLQENPKINLKDAAFTLQTGRKFFKYRKIYVGSTIEDVVEKLSSNTSEVQTFCCEEQTPPVIFIFSGQGNQYVNMGLELYQKEKLFREEMNRCFTIAKSIMGYDLKEILYPDIPVSAVREGGGEISPVSSGAKSNNQPAADNQSQAMSSEKFNQTKIVSTLLFIFEYALAKLLMNWGIRPRAMMGYSLGEYVAACISGVFSLEDALKLVVTKGEYIEKTPPGTMLSIPLTEKEIKPLLNNKNVSLSIVNGLTCVVSGTVQAVKDLEQQMKEKELLCVPINTSHAAHSHLMVPIREEFVEHVRRVPLSKPRIPYISNVSGCWIRDDEAVNPSYWGDHLCSTVRFSDGIEELLKQDPAVFIEIGPGRILSFIIRQHILLKKQAHDKKKSPPPRQRVVNLIRNQQEELPDDYFFLRTMGQLWLYGVELDWTGFYQGEKRHRIPLPPYPFARTRHWIDENIFKRLAAWQSLARAEESESVQEIHHPENLPAIDRHELDQQHEPPRNELEHNITQVWQQFLGLEKIGIHDNFFHLKGDSLTATQLILRLKEIFPVEITTQDFYQEPTIAHLTGVIKKLLTEQVKNLSEEEFEKLRL